MQVQMFIATGVAPFTFALSGSNRTSSIVSPWRIKGHWQVQKTNNIRAVNPVLQARLNNLCTVTFRVQNLWSTLSAAEAFCLTYKEIVPASGTLVFTTEADGGKITRWLYNAVLEDVDSTYMGLTTFHDHTFSGAGMMTVAPT